MLSFSRNDFKNGRLRDKKFIKNFLRRLVLTYIVIGDNVLLVTLSRKSRILNTLTHGSWMIREVEAQGSAHRQNFKIFLSRSGPT